MIKCDCVGCVWLLCLSSIFYWGSSLAAAQEQYVLQGGQWQKQNEVNPDSPEGGLQLIRRALAQDEPKEALEQADQWIEEHTDHPGRVEAYLLRGDAKAAQGEYYQSLYDYELAVRQFPASPFYETLLQRQFQIAKVFASGVKRKFLGLRVISADSEVEEIFIRIQERVPGSEVGEQASRALGDFYFDRRQMGNALVAYEMFLVNYPNSPHRSHAKQRMIEASLETFRGPRYDPTGLIEATQRIKDFEKEFPAAAQEFDARRRLARIEELLAMKLLHNARWYEKQGQRVSATYVYQRVLRDYSHTSAAQSALEYLAGLGMLVSQEYFRNRTKEDSGHTPPALIGR